MSKKILLICGCVASATDRNNNPSCPVHDCSVPYEFDETLLIGREAECTSCGKRRKSSLNLPFFALGRFSKGKKLYDMDSYYCGCRGWD